MERSKEITSTYLKALNDHLADIVAQRATEMLEINEIAELLNINATYLSNTIKQETGHSACHFYQTKIIDIIKSLLKKDEMNITQISYLLTYDPSNFTKLFKSYTQQTPKQYRDDFREKVRQT